MSENIGVELLPARGRIVRAVVTVVAAIALLAGTLVGSDDDFPFGPFRMYATTDKLDAPVADTRVDAVDTTGHPLLLTERETGIRRAEIEGQLARFAADPTRLSVVADAYARRHPDAPPVAEVSIVIRWHELKGGRPTGTYHDETRAVWRR